MKAEQLITYWSDQGINIIAASQSQIKKIEQDNNFVLPNDFKKLYLAVNGMSASYPNDNDNEGFLFYPVDKIISSDKEFKNTSLKSANKIFIFANYMHKSWWYGFKILDDHNYIIGIIPDRNTFTPIAESVWDFIELYIKDSPKIYNQ